MFLYFCGLSASWAGGGEFELLNVPRVFSPSRLPLPLTEAPYAISIIDREDIEYSGVSEIFELLRFSPGVTVFQTGAAEAAVGMRGVNGIHANNILILLDGRPIYNDFAGDNLLSYLPVDLEDLERIEIVRGPQSILYGANAYSGVINLITRKPPTYSRLTLRPGIPYRHQYSLALTEQRTWGNFYLSGSWDEVGSFSDHEDRARRMKKIYGYIHRDLGSGTVSLSGGLSRGALAYFAIPNRAETDRQGFNSFLRAEYHQGSLELEASWQTFEEEFRYQDFFRNWINIDYLDLCLRKGLHPSPGQWLLLGLNSRYNTYSTGYALRRYSQFIYSLFGEYKTHLGQRFILWTGLRLRHHPETGNKAFPRISIIYSLAPGQSLRFSAGTAYKDPTYLELYEDLHPRPWIHEVGNRHLRPERLKSYELAYQAWLSKNLYLGISLFRNRYQDVLGSTVEVDSGSLYVHRANLLSLDQYGGEMELSLRPGAFWLFRANYQYVWGEKVKETVFGPVPQHQLNGQIRYLAPQGWWLEILLHLQDDSGYSIRDRRLNRYLWKGLSPYFLVNLTLGYQPHKGPLKISFTVHNLFNDVHKEYPSGERLGTWFEAKIDYHF
ncbi:TonB-dependent receptor plug domain-containing protein [Thermosulfuriphilus sp.]